MLYSSNRYYPENPFKRVFMRLLSNTGSLSLHCSVECINKEEKTNSQETQITVTIGYLAEVFEVAPDKSGVKSAASKALKMMRDSGFSITGKVKVTVDPDLPFMGYSTQRAGGNIVVVAGRAVESGLIEGLLIHELCHVYRTETGHPSHDHQLLNHVGTRVIHENELNKDYQVKIIQQAVNNVQDLYADDLSFQVFKKWGAFTPEQAHGFFLDWINDTPLEEKSSRDRWQNVGTMLNNCFAISNLTRHKIPDIEDQAEIAVQRFLSKVDDRMRSEFIYFRNFMVSLAEDVTRQQFEKDLSEYLTRVVQLTEK
jgi:hypothetical protein